FDAHAAEWASPYGLVGLLAAGEAARRAGGEKPLLTAPTHADVLRYWARAGFFREAAELFEIHGRVPRVKGDESAVLLPVTPVRAAEDVHAVVSRIQQRASAILASELGLEPKATMGFAMALSEACQNIVEHAGTAGRGSPGSDGISPAGTARSPSGAGRRASRSSPSGTTTCRCRRASRRSPAPRCSSSFPSRSPPSGDPTHRCTRRAAGDRVGRVH